MLNQSTLDTLIACVVVILILSLIVQAIQTAIKKLLKLKSRQIEDSLVDLFQNTFKQLGTKPAANYDPKCSKWSWQWVKQTFKAFVNRSPVFQLLLGDHSADLAESAEVRSLYSSVVGAFKDVGRVTAHGNLMLDSLAKEDLLKMLGKVGANKLLPEADSRLAAVATKIDGALKQIQDLRATINGAESELSVAAKSEFDQIKFSLLPLLDEISTFLGGGKSAMDVLLADVQKIADGKTYVTDSLVSLQKRLQDDLDEALAAKPPDTPVADALKAILAGVAAITNAFGELTQHVDAASSALRARLDDFGSWFDTIMQSFDERYTRSMKTWAIVISFAVVVSLNANVFDLYKNVSTSTILRDTLVKNGEAIVKDAEKRDKETGEKGKQDTLSAAKPGANINTPAENSTPSSGNETGQGVKEAQVIESYMKDYANFGFKPFIPSWDRWWKNSFKMEKEKGWDLAKWGKYRAHDALHVLGWVCMALLLSVGAPFWEDTLESLFGIKSLLRNKSETKNVEQKSGAGQPKP